MLAAVIKALGSSSLSTNTLSPLALCRLPTTSHSAIIVWHRFSSITSHETVSLPEVPMSFVLPLLIAMLSLASPPPSAPKKVLPTFERVRSPTEFIRRLSKMHPPSSPAIKLAQIISAPRRGKPSFAFVKAKWGTYAFAWSMEARFLAIWQPDGHMSCEADGGPCPTDEELGPLPKGLFYDWNQCMGTPAGIGMNGRYFAEPPTEDGFSLIRTYPGGDGADAREDVLSFSAD